MVSGFTHRLSTPMYGCGDLKVQTQYIHTCLLWLKLAHLA